MSVELTLELSDRADSAIIQRALESYRTRLQSSIERGARTLHGFEERYQVTTQYFLDHLTAEDLQGGDIEYVEWAGEAKLVAGLQAELRVLENVRYKIP
jgi:hypothetical protein